MFDRIFGAALAFCALAGGTLAIGAALFEFDRPTQPVAQATQQVVQLPSVEVISRHAGDVRALATAEPQQRRAQ